MDYYTTLGIHRDATTEDVKKAYRRAAPKYHPDSHPDNLSFCTKKFAEVAEAYEVLADLKLRAIYDQYGEDGIKGALPSKLGISPFFPSSPNDVFLKFFGTVNPHAVAIIPSSEELKFNPLVEPPKTLPPTFRRVPVTLEDIFIGSTKRVDVGSGHTLTFDVPRGITDGTQLKYPGKGFEPEGGDAIIIVDEEAKHPRFKRKGETLVYTAKITLAEALLGCIVELQTLDGRLLRVSINEIVHPGYVKVVAGEGLPKLGTETKQGTCSMGDLHIVFDVKYPASLNEKQRKQLRIALINGGVEPVKPTPPPVDALTASGAL